MGVATSRTPEGGLAGLTLEGVGYRLGETRYGNSGGGAAVLSAVVNPELVSLRDANAAGLGTRDVIISSATQETATETVADAGRRQRTRLDFGSGVTLPKAMRSDPLRSRRSPGLGYTFPVPQQSEDPELRHLRCRRRSSDIWNCADSATTMSNTGRERTAR